MSSPVLEVRDLWVGWDDLPAVRGLDLQIDAGEVVALLGPNGAGKTTTLLTLSGLLRPSRGTVRFLGEPIDDRRPDRLVRAGLAHVPDDRGLFDGLTVRQHLELRRPKDRRAAVERTVGWFPALEALLDRRAGLLSGGEQQMLALAQALVGEPELLMIDEMSLGLAPLVVESLLPVVRRVAEGGCGVLLVEQHVDMALGVADRAVVLNRGDVVVSGPAAALAADRDLLRRSYLGTPTDTAS